MILTSNKPFDVVRPAFNNGSCVFDGAIAYKWLNGLSYLVPVLTSSNVAVLYCLLISTNLRPYSTLILRFFNSSLKN